MKQFFDDYFNIAKMIKNKREYKDQMKRLKELPEDYQYVYKKIQSHMWQFVEELLKNTRTHIEDWKTKFNYEIRRQLKSS